MHRSLWKSRLKAIKIISTYIWGLNAWLLMWTTYPGIKNIEIVNLHINTVTQWTWRHTYTCDHKPHFNCLIINISEYMSSSEINDSGIAFLMLCLHHYPNNKMQTLLNSRNSNSSFTFRDTYIKSVLKHWTCLKYKCQLFTALNYHVWIII